MKLKEEYTYINHEFRLILYLKIVCFWLNCPIRRPFRVKRIIFFCNAYYVHIRMKHLLFFKAKYLQVPGMIPSIPLSYC